ncbi:MAG: DNA repair protein RecN [Clostridia bacterium]|nr:DNA repair protein RecN [Clostridia bacterium]
MLRELRIENFILITKLHLNFNKGLNIFTGETGAGKSMIIGAINAGLGEKVNSDCIRIGAEKAEVQLIFDIEDQEVSNGIKALGVEMEDTLLIVTRVILPSNRSTIRLNDRVVTLSTLNEVGKLLMDIHGQHAHQGLLYPKNHLKYLDMMGSSNHQADLEQVFTSYHTIKQIQQKLEHLVNLSPEYDADYLSYQLNEIDALNLTEEDDEPLTQKYEYYKHLETIHSHVSQLSQLFSADEGYSIKDMLQTGISLIQPIHSYDEQLDRIHGALHNMMYAADDAFSELRHFMDNMEVDEEEMRYVEERVNTINHLKMKHGKKITDILEKREEINRRLKEIEQHANEIQFLEQQLVSEKRNYLKAAKALSESRQQITKLFVQGVTVELDVLNMKDSIFDIKFFENTLNEGEYRLSPYGLDQVEFMISTNPGMPIGPLSKIASGGEMSRIMLAIKLALAHHDAIDTLVFDEVDTGISGHTARVVGEKLYDVSSNYQVLCITHLPQIAAMADEHFLIQKNSYDASTETSVLSLNSEERKRELARMLSGQVSEVSLRNAEEMVADANRIKLS